MGSPEDANPPASLPNSIPTASATIASLPGESPSSWQANSAHWAASAQAYYSSGAGTQPAFFLPFWGSQHLMPLCGTPIVSPMYASSAIYAHPSIIPGMGYLPEESMMSHGSPYDFVRVNETSCSREEDGSQTYEQFVSSHGGVKADPHDSRDESSGPQDHVKKRPFEDVIQEGEDESQPETAESKLPVLVPSMITMPDARDFYEAMPDHCCIQDEHKLKRERRKLHNRESLLRSRLSKQQKTQELDSNVAKLKGENAQLRIELEQLHKLCSDLEAENHHISEEISSISEK